MRFSLVAAALTGATLVHSHGLLTLIKGANNVTMPGLSVIAGTPRDCSTNGCGAEADTSIIRKQELGGNKASALGRTQGGGPVDAEAAVANFMGASATTATAASSVPIKRAPAYPEERDVDADAVEKRSLLIAARDLLSQLLSGQIGQNNNDGASTNTVAATTDTSPAQLMPGAGATSGLPTCADDGTVNMVYHQVNQDGAGPLQAFVDPTSGGTDPSAFVAATMVADVPGIAAGLSPVTDTDFNIAAKMPAGTVCSGTVAGQTGVCIMRLNNNTPAGPFGGSVAFIQSPAAKKRALEYLALKKRHFARGVVARATEDEEAMCDE